MTTFAYVSAYGVEPPAPPEYGRAKPSAQGNRVTPVT